MRPFRQFCIDFHRSIFDPGFFREISGRTAGAVILHLVIMTGSVALVGGCARAWHSIDPRGGLPAHLADIFRGIEIRGGVLYSSRPLPYIPSRARLQPVLSMILHSPSLAQVAPDTLLTVDTLDAGALRAVRSPGLYMGRERVVLHSGKSVQTILDYRTVVGPGTFGFTREEFHRILLGSILALCVNSVIQDCILNAASILFSVFFLAFAAYIFRLERNRRVGFFTRMASFAVAPVAAGNLLVAIAGVYYHWTWHISAFCATIVMFRGLKVINSPPAAGESSS